MPRLTSPFALSVNGLATLVIFDVLLSHHLSPFNIGWRQRGYYYHEASRHVEAVVSHGDCR